VKVSHNAVWLFLRREGLRSKKLWSLWSRSAPTSLAGNGAGAPSRRAPRPPASGVPRRGRDQGQHGAPGGWGPKGERVRAFSPHGLWRTLTFFGALRYDHLRGPGGFDSPTNGECFRAYV